MNRKVPLKIRKLMKELKEGLVRIYGDRLKAVYLYGSYARGDYRPGSDVDVMILLKDYKNYWEEIRKTSVLMSEVSLEYDLLVPPYDAVKIATVGQAEAKIQHSRVITGKRLGFQFNSDDVLISNPQET